MGDIADYYVEQMITGNSSVGSYYPKTRKRKESDSNMYGNKQPNYERQVKKVFKMINGDNGEYGVIVEQGISKETIAVSFDRSKFRAKGFISQKESLFNSSYKDVKEVINMHEVMSSLVTVLNNLYSADLLSEDMYNNVIDGYEPFLYEALAYEEFKNFLEPSSIGSNKKKRVSRRGRA
jgi:hypothetical protein